jgi:hypothetical protein
MRETTPGSVGPEDEWRVMVWPRVIFTRKTGATTSVKQGRTRNPAFAADGYHLQASSVALGAGVAATTVTGIHGEPRKPFLTWALGATRKVFLPLVVRNHP